jgi:hypothetical protein
VSIIVGINVPQTSRAGAYFETVPKNKDGKHGE